VTRRLRSSIRPSGLPPYSSVLRFVCGLRNWLSRKPWAPCNCMPLNPADFATRAPCFQRSTASSISGIVKVLDVPRRDCTASLSNHLSPRVTGTDEGHRAGMSAGRLPAPAGDNRPGCASCTMQGGPPDCAICAHCFQVSKCGEGGESERQATSPVMERLICAWSAIDSSKRPGR
jgi:hypothetical protein